MEMIFTSHLLVSLVSFLPIFPSSQEEEINHDCDSAAGGDLALKWRWIWHKATRCWALKQLQQCLATRLREPMTGGLPGASGIFQFMLRLAAFPL